MTATGEFDPNEPLVISETRFRYRLAHLFYGIIYVGASLATFGIHGIWPAVVFLSAWAYVFGSSNRLRALLNVVFVMLVGTCLCGLVMPAMQAAREAARRTVCASHIKHILNALHAYHDKNGEFPPAYLTDEQGKPMHSWRVLILPYLYQQALYDAYQFDEPWDGPNNSKLLNMMPNDYSCPADVRWSRGSHGPHTNYLAIVGPNNAWAGSVARKLSEIPYDTIMIMETQAKQVQWLEPVDLNLDAVALEFSLHVDGSVAGHRSGDFFYE
ncbi:MAG: DUF1559 domain-containing protein, partial [Blastocatellia bacterium]